MEYVECWNCEENFHCSDAQRMDGCELGLATVDDNEEKLESVY